MTAKQRLIEEIEKASDSLVEEVLNYLLNIKEKNNLHSTKKNDSQSIEEQLQMMANDPQIQTEIALINEEFKVTEMDGLS